MRFVLAAWLAGVGADTWQTCGALDRGAVELVQTQSCGANVAINAGEAAIGVWGLRKFHKTHPRAAIVLGVAAAGFRFSMAARNARINR